MKPSPHQWVPNRPKPSRMHPGHADYTRVRYYSYHVVLFCLWTFPTWVVAWRWELTSLVLMLLSASSISSVFSAFDVGTLLLGLAYGVTGLYSIKMWHIDPNARASHHASRSMKRRIKDWDKHAKELGINVVKTRHNATKTITPVVTKQESFGSDSFSFDITLPVGLQGDDVKKNEQKLAVAFNATRVNVEQLLEASKLRVTVIGGGDLMYGKPMPPTPITSQKTGRSIREPILAGYDSRGESVWFTPVDGSLLLSGAAGSGKSVEIQSIIAQVALCRDVKLVCIDPKVVELKIWERSSTLYASSKAEAVKVLKQVEEWMDARYEWLGSLEGYNPKVEDFDKINLIFVAIEEFAELSLFDEGDSEDKAMSAAIVKSVRRLVSKGRAAGVVVMIATQQPNAKVLPTIIRTQPPIRIGLRTAEAESAKMGMGDSAIAQGADSSKIHKSAKGVGWLAGEASTPQLFKGYFVPQKDLEAIAERAAEMHASK